MSVYGGQPLGINQLVFVSLFIYLFAYLCIQWMPVISTSSGTA